MWIKTWWWMKISSLTKMTTQMQFPIRWLNHMEFCELFHMCHLNEIVHEIYNMDESEFHENKSQCQWYWKQFHPCISICLCEAISYVLPSIDLHPYLQIGLSRIVAFYSILLHMHTLLFKWQNGPRIKPCETRILFHHCPWTYH
jgi:hypothetical protein